MKSSLYIFFGFILITCNPYISIDARGDARTLGKNEMKGSYTLRTVCVDGYKFVIANRFDRETAKAASQSLTQVREKAGGFQFIAVQATPSEKVFTGFWMLRDLA